MAQRVRWLVKQVSLISGHYAEIELIVPKNHVRCVGIAFGGLKSEETYQNKIRNQFIFENISKANMAQVSIQCNNKVDKLYAGDAEIILPSSLKRCHPMTEVDIPLQPLTIININIKSYLSIRDTINIYFKCLVNDER